MMVVISVSILVSTEQIIPGIPQSVAITANGGANIFYTLDGTDPTLFSTVYTNPIIFTDNKPTITLKVFATNGVNSSPIITEMYIADVDGNRRLPHSATSLLPSGGTPDRYPFGTPPSFPHQKYFNPGDTGITIYNPALPATPTGFDGDGYPAAYTNYPFNIQNYGIVYSTTDAEGQPAGNKPGGVIYDPAQDPAYGGEETDQFSNTFDPRSFVIFQDFSKQDPTVPPVINRQFFTLENPERTRDGTMLFNAGIDNTIPPSGSYINSYYNPRTNEITQYFRDGWSGQWIISKSPAVNNGGWNGDMTTAATDWNGRVFEWPSALGRYRTLF